MIKINVEKRYNNPPNQRLLNLMLIIGIYSIVLGVMFFIFNPSLIGPIILTIFGIIIYFQMWWRQHIISPRFIEVVDEGIILTYQYKKPELINWNDIFIVDIGPSTSSPNLKIPRESVIKIKGRASSIPMTYEIAKIIRDKYFEKMGTYPMSLKEFHR